MVLAAGLVLSLFLPSTVFAQTSSCNGSINLGYNGGDNFAVVGSVYTVEAALGTGTITGGAANTLTVNRFRFELDCNADFALGIPCTDAGMRVSYSGNLDDSGCPAGAPWTAAPNAGNANQIIFTPAAPFAIAANTDPLTGCIVEFDVTVEATPSLDSTPNQIEEVVGYSVANTDAMCDNGLTSGANQTGAIPLCQVCTGDDGNDCTGDPVCNPDNNVCEFPNEPASTACEDTGNECAVAGCDGQGNCDQLHTPEPSSTACTDTALECAVAGCDGAGACVQDHTPEPSSTACTDTGNECAVAGCDGQGNCDQLHTPEPSSTACADTDLECAIAGCDGAGACVQDHTPEPSSTACTDTGNECAVAGCDGQGNCDQLHTPEPSSTACTDTGNVCFDAGCDGAGACNQEHTAAPPCDDPTCEACDPVLGCVPITPEPAECVDEEICRTPGFWATHGGTEKPNSQNITLAVLDGGLEVCGTIVDNTDVGNSMSAIEAMCVSIKGEKQRQVVRQLTASALNCSIGTCSQEHLDLLADCNDVCANEVTEDYNSCIDQLDCFNNGGLWDGDSCVTGIGFCAPQEDIAAVNGNGLAVPCSDEEECGLGEICVPIETCHDRDLCPDFTDDGEINGSDFCFEPPGSAGSTGACKAARKNDVFVP